MKRRDLPFLQDLRVLKGSATWVSFSVARNATSLSPAKLDVLF